MEKDMDRYYGTGRRKNAVAKVWLTPGNGVFTVNGKEVKTFFNRDAHQIEIFGPLKDTGMEGRFDIKVVAKGGGISGQAGAIRLGIARALVQMDESLRKQLRANGHMTRDPRMKERKKFGQPGARKHYQYSKR